MNCYKDPRKTNEDTDSCAETFRADVQDLQKGLKSQLMNNCKWLEDCTDTCSGAADMKCIN